MYVYMRQGVCTREYAVTSQDVANHRDEQRHR